MDYEQWQIEQSIPCQNPSTKIIIRRNSSSRIIQKKITTDARNRDYAKLELNLMREINSPFVAKYLHHTAHDNTLTVYMPYYPNQDLKTYLLKHPHLPLPTKIQCLIDILTGLLELHSRFIIHRDIKAENIFVDENGRCLVGDLGIATRAAGGVASRLGTVGLQAPEVYSEKEYDEKVDMWAVGIIAYQLFNRQREGQLAFPFGRHQDLGKQILFRGGGDVVYDSYHKATLQFTPNDPDLPPALSQMLSQMLKNDPTQRLSWVQLYQRGYLTDFDPSDRLITFKADYESIGYTKQTMQQYMLFISQSKPTFHRLSRLLHFQQIELHQQKYPSVACHLHELHIFFFRLMAKLRSKFDFIKKKKIYRYVLEEKEFMKLVEKEYDPIEKRINFWLRKKGEKEIAGNRKYLEGKYYEELERKVEKVLGEVGEIHGE